MRLIKIGLCILALAAAFALGRASNDDCGFDSTQQCVTWSHHNPFSASDIATAQRQVNQKFSTYHHDFIAIVDDAFGNGIGVTIYTKRGRNTPKSTQDEIMQLALKEAQAHQKLTETES